MNQEQVRPWMWMLINQCWMNIEPGGQISRQCTIAIVGTKLRPEHVLQKSITANLGREGLFSEYVQGGKNIFSDRESQVCSVDFSFVNWVMRSTVLWLFWVFASLIYAPDPLKNLSTGFQCLTSTAIHMLCYHLSLPMWKLSANTNLLHLIVDLPYIGLCWYYNGRRSEGIPLVQDSICSFFQNPVSSVATVLCIFVYTHILVIIIYMYTTCIWGEYIPAVLMQCQE